MARRRKASSKGPGQGWLVTFSDLMTLLLTFFVLLLSMSSMDTVTISRISSFTESLSPMEVATAARLSDRIRMVTDLLRDPDTILEKQDRIKDLLFPHDLLPPELSPGDLADNLSILQHPEGVVIVLTDSLLFAPGSAALSETGLHMVGMLTPVLQALNTDVNISGHTDSTPGRGINNDDLSALRALSVLERFLHDKLPPDRFSVSGYGADKPMYSNATEAGRVKNRRVEILVKTTQWIGRYV